MTIKPMSMAIIVLDAFPIPKSPVISSHQDPFMNNFSLYQPVIGKVKLSSLSSSGCTMRPLVLLVFIVFRNRHLKKLDTLLSEQLFFILRSGTPNVFFILNTIMHF